MIDTQQLSTFEKIVSMVQKARIARFDEVLFTCSYFPRELAEAFGLKTSRLNPCGTQLCESEGHKKLGPEACSYCKAIIGGPKISAPQALFGCTTCDQMRRLIEEVGRNSDSGFEFVNIPATRTAAALEHYQNEIIFLSKKLQDMTGLFLDLKRLEKIVYQRNAIRKKLREFRPNLVSYEFVALLHLEMLTPPQEMLDFLENFRPERANKIHKTKVMLAGSPLTLEDTDFLAMLDHMGIDVVADATCTGDRWIDFEIKLGANPILGLAKSYFERPGCIWLRPNDEFYAYAKSLASKKGAKGVIWRSVKFCDLWSLESQRAKEKLGLSLLALDMNYSDTTSGRTQTRVEAFAEGLT